MITDIPVKTTDTMKFTVSTSTLQKQLQVLSGAVSTNTTLPILEDFLFSLSGSTLTIIATDLETSISSQIDVLSDSEGTIAIPAKILLDTLKSLPDQPLTFSVDLENCAIEIISQNGKYKLTGDQGEDYPMLPAMDEVANISLPANVLIDAISTTLFAVSNDDLRPTMMGVYVKLSDTGITFVSTDAHKLVKYHRSDIVSEAAANFILPKKALQLIKNAIISVDTNIEVSYNNTNAFFKFDGVQVICRLIEGQYPNYDAVIPVDNEKDLFINRADFENSLKRLAIYANKTTHQVNMVCSQDDLQLIAKDIDFSNEAKEHLTCRYNHEDLEIAFNARFLVDIMKALSAEEICIKLSAPSKAGVIKPTVLGDGEDLLVLIMPIML